MMKRYGEPVRRDKRYQIRPGAYVILVLGNSVLLTHQAEPTPEFQLPGGGIDPGEGPVTALHRETFEETGWRISAPRRLGAYRRFTFMPEYDKWAEKICHIYVARPVRRHGPPSEPGHTAVWMPVETAVHQLANAGDSAFLQMFL